MIVYWICFDNFTRTIWSALSRTKTVYGFFAASEQEEKFVQVKVKCLWDKNPHLFYAIS
jgi:hypothetical protein